MTDRNADKPEEMILGEWNGRAIRIRKDGHFSATDLTLATGKPFVYWLTLAETKAEMEKLSLMLGVPVGGEASTRAGSRAPLIEEKKEESSEEQGSWVRLELAICFAKWCGADFFFYLESLIDQLYYNGAVRQREGGGSGDYEVDPSRVNGPPRWTEFFSPTFIKHAERVTGSKWGSQEMTQFIEETICAHMPPEVAEGVRKMLPRAEGGRKRLN
jgi:hypothetical protein